MAGPEGKERCARRKWMAAAPHGWNKEAMGFRRFGVQGLENVKGEWKLTLMCLVLNARRMAAALVVPDGLSPAEAQPSSPGCGPRAEKRVKSGTRDAENPTGVRRFRAVRRSGVTSPRSVMTCGAGSWAPVNRGSVPQGHKMGNLHPTVK